MRYRFSNCTLDTALCELRRVGVPRRASRMLSRFVRRDDELRIVARRLALAAELQPVLERFTEGFARMTRLIGSPSRHHRFVRSRHRPRRLA